MNLKEYQSLALVTFPRLSSSKKDIAHLKSGIFTEIGELVDCMKKNLAYNKPYDTPNIKEEIGDAMWYVVCLDAVHEKVTEKPFFYVSYAGWDLENVIEDILASPFATTDIISSHILRKLHGICDFFQVDLRECLEINIQKLKARYPDGFNEEKAINRNLTKERQILEQ